MSHEDVESVFLGEPISYVIDVSGISPRNDIIDVSGSRDTVVSYAIDISGGGQTVPIHHIDITQGEKQLYKGQDFVASGYGVDDITGEHYLWALLCDGHGDHIIIDSIRKTVSELNPEAPNNFMNKASPILALQEELSKIYIRPFSSGSTCINAKIFKETCRIESSGDSFVFVLNRGTVIWKNKLHKWENLEEQSRLKKLYGARISASPIKAIKLMATDTLREDDPTYILFPPYHTPLATSQALGHNNMTGLAPDTFTFPLDPAEEYTIIAFSDGVGDMLMIDNEEEMAAIFGMSVPEILAFAEARWKQLWYFADPKNPDIKNGPYRFTKSNEFDDLSCFKVIIKPM